MAEDRPEDADVIAPTIAEPNHCLGINLIGNTQTGSEVLIVSVGVAGQIDAILTSNANFAREGIDPTALTGATNRFGLIDFPPEPEVNGQFVRDPYGVLSEEEKARLSLVRVRRGADVASESAHVAQEKGRQTRSASSARTLRLVLGEIELTSPVDVAGDT